MSPAISAGYGGPLQFQEEHRDRPSEVLVKAGWPNAKGQDHAGGTWTGIRGSATGQPAEAASHIKLAAPLLNQKEAAVITAVAGMQDTGHFK